MGHRHSGRPLSVCGSIELRVSGQRRAMLSKKEGQMWKIYPSLERRTGEAVGHGLG